MLLAADPAAAAPISRPGMVYVDWTGRVFGRILPEDGMRRGKLVVI